MMTSCLPGKDVSSGHNHTTTMLIATTTNMMAEESNLLPNRNNVPPTGEAGNADTRTFITGLMGPPPQDIPKQQRRQKTQDSGDEEKDDKYLQIRADDDEDDIKEKLIIQEINQQLEEFNSDQVTQLKTMISKTKESMNTMISDISHIHSLLSEINTDTKSIGYKIKCLDNFDEQFMQVLPNKYGSKQAK